MQVFKNCVQKLKKLGFSTDIAESNQSQILNLISFPVVSERSTRGQFMNGFDTALFRYVRYIVLVGTRHCRVPTGY